jgi:hypothetical protein
MLREATFPSSGRAGGRAAHVLTDAVAVNRDGGRD